MSSPYNIDRIRLSLTKGGGLSDQNTGSAPQFVINTDVQFELALNFRGALVDSRNITSVTLALKPTNNIDAVSLMSGTATSANSGWNTNPAFNIGDDVIPNSAVYDNNGNYLAGVQTGATYTWTRGSNEYSAYNGTSASGALINGSNIQPNVPPYTTGVYYFAKNLTGKSGGNVAGDATGPAIIGGPTTSPALTASGFFYTLGSPTVGGASSCGIFNTQLGSNLILGASYSGTSYQLAGLTIGQTYLATFGANDAQLNCGPALVTNVVTNAALFVASSTTATLTCSQSNLASGTYSNPSQFVTTIPLPSTYTTPTTSIFPTTYSAAGVSTVSGLVLNNTYTWTKGANDTSLVLGNQTLTTTGVFVATATTATLNGTANTSVTATVVSTQAVATATFVSGNTYTWTKGANDSAIIVTTAAGVTTYSSTSTFQVASSNALLVGTGTVTASITLDQALYSGTGTYGTSSVFPLAPGGVYKWTQGTYDTQLQCGSTVLTASGIFVASSSTATLTGTNGALVGTSGLAQLSLAPAAIQSNAVAVGETYQWTPGANDVALINGSTILTAAGTFTATSTAITSVGLATLAVSSTLIIINPPVTMTVQQVSVVNSGSVVATQNQILITGVPNQPVTATLTGNVSWQDGSDQHCVISFNRNQTLSFWVPPSSGNTNTYWLLITALTNDETVSGQSNGEIVLGAANVTVVDDGNSTGVPNYNPTTGLANLIPVGATYNNSVVYNGVTPPFQLTAGQYYYYVLGANDSGINNNGTSITPLLTTSGYFYVGGTAGKNYTVALNGTANQVVTAVIYAVTAPYPFPMTVSIPSGSTVSGTPGFTISGLNLPFNPVGCQVTIMMPHGGVAIGATPDASTLTNNGVTIYADSQFSTSGYVATVTFF